MHSTTFSQVMTTHPRARESGAVWAEAAILIAVWSLLALGILDILGVFDRYQRGVIALREGITHGAMIAHRGDNSVNPVHGYYYNPPKPYSDAYTTRALSSNPTFVKPSTIFADLSKVENCQRSLFTAKDCGTIAVADRIFKSLASQGVPLNDENSEVSIQRIVATSGTPILDVRVRLRSDLFTYWLSDGWIQVKATGALPN